MRPRLLVPLLALCAVFISPGSVQAEQIKQNIRIATPDGTSLAARLAGEGPLSAKPVIVEFGPYGQDCCPQSVGPDYNYLHVHIRGTGDSDGAFDALGPQTQKDVRDVLAWACTQPWSNGRLGLYGFSASAITVYNSLNLPLPCVQTAVLGAGTHELYRDLLYPGGLPNLVPGIGVLAGIGAPALANGPTRLQRDLAEAVVEPTAGMTNIGFSYLLHPTLDQWWRERGMRGDVNDIPVLMITSFYDVESRGPFQTYQELRGDGAHLYVVGAHDGEPAPGGRAAAEQRRWYDRYLRDVPNGVDTDPKVQLLLSDGDREDWNAGRFVKVDGADWPIPGTEWAPLKLGPDHSLGTATPATSAQHPYISLPSLPTATDIHTTSLLYQAGGVHSNPLANLLSDMTLPEPLGLSYTTRPLASDVVSAGPANLQLRLTSTAAESDLYAVLSDVSPDGRAHPVATARLRSSFPDIDPARSLTDGNGEIVQPYGNFASKRYAKIGEERLYQLEFWPIGNRFKAGHRIRLHVIGGSLFHLPAPPAINLVRAGGPNGSRLLFPVLPGSDIGAALGG